MEFTGEFETHFTIQSDEPHQMVALRQWAKVHGLKFSHIVLSRGLSVSQPMLTRRGVGGLTSEIDVALEVAQSLAVEGYDVTRIKIEANPENEDIPASDEDLSYQTTDRYFEHHIKLLLDGSSDRARLLRIAQEQGAHLSRNAFCQREDGAEERFVTQRCHQAGRERARKSLKQLEQALRGEGFQILDVEEEYVVYDGNLTLDVGWLELPAEAVA
jgi:hypothetical protein